MLLSIAWLVRPGSHISISQMGNACYCGSRLQSGMFELLLFKDSAHKTWMDGVSDMDEYILPPVAKA